MTDTRCLVIALCGLPGAGKTSVASAVEDRFPVRKVDRDRIREAMFPLCAFSETEKAASNEAVMATVAANCQLGFDSLVDGMTFSTRVQRSDFAAMVRECGGRFAILFLDCPVDTARERVRAASSGEHPAGDRDADLVERIASRFEPPEGEGVRVDAGQSLEAVRQQAADAVGALMEMYSRSGLGTRD